MSSLFLNQKHEIAVGQPRVPVPIFACFTEIEDHFNNALVGDDNLTSPNNSVWRTVHEVGGAFNNGGDAAGTYILCLGDVWSLASSGGGAVRGAFWHPNSAGSAVAGKTTQVRLRGDLLTNGTAPGVTLTIGLHPVNSVGGGALTLDVVLGSAVATVAFTTPAVNSLNRAEGTAVSLPAAGTYALAATPSGTVAANSRFTISAAVEMRHN